MQKYNVQGLREVSASFSDFCKGAAHLSKNTPLFMTDEKGRVVAEKHLTKSGFSSMGEILDDGEFREYVKEKYANDGFVVKPRDDRMQKSYIAMTHVGDGLFGGVVCSYCEENCSTLSEYFEKLSLYRDYLDLLSQGGASYTSALGAFDGRICGIGCLLKLPSGHMASKKTALPVRSVFEKLGGFSEKLGALTASRCRVTMSGDNPVVSVSMKFVYAAMCCLALVLRNSSDALAEVRVINIDESLAEVSVTARIQSVPERDIYRKAVEDAVKEHCKNLEIVQSQDRYTVKLLLEKAKKQALVVSEVSFADREMERILSEKQLSDMFFAITDI